jgi:hypothetical protein
MSVPRQRSSSGVGAAGDVTTRADMLEELQQEPISPVHCELARLLPSSSSSSYGCRAGEGPARRRPPRMPDGTMYDITARPICAGRND